MAEKRKDASSSKENEEPNGRRGPGGGLEPRTHAPSIEEHTTWSGGSGDGSAGLATDPGSSRWRLSSGEEKARSARRQPSLWQRTPLAPTYSRRRAPRDPPRLAPARSPTPGMTQTPPARTDEPDGGAHRSARRCGHAPRGELVHVGRASPFPAALPLRLGTAWSQRRRPLGTLTRSLEVVKRAL